MMRKGRSEWWRWGRRSVEELAEVMESGGVELWVGRNRVVSRKEREVRMGDPGLRSVEIQTGDGEERSQVEQGAEPQCFSTLDNDGGLEEGRGGQRGELRMEEDSRAQPQAGEEHHQQDGGSLEELMAMEREMEEEMEWQ